MIRKTLYTWDFQKPLHNIPHQRLCMKLSSQGRRDQVGPPMVWNLETELQSRRSLVQIPPWPQTHKLPLGQQATLCQPRPCPSSIDNTGILILSCLTGLCIESTSGLINDNPHHLEKRKQRVGVNRQFPQWGSGDPQGYVWDPVLWFINHLTVWAQPIV